MTQTFVERLARLHPGYSKKSFETGSTVRQVHLTPAYGWEFACDFADARMKFPLTVLGREKWLYLAYLLRLSPATCPCRDVEDAHEIHVNPSLSAKLNAMLMAGLGQPPDDHLSLVSEKTGIPKPTVEAYETLFFNVLDRPRDRLYISHIVYPKTRVVEFDEDYFDKTPIADLLLRAAFNHRDIDLILRLTGMTDAACRQELATLREQEKQLGSSIMGSAWLMSQLGFLNQRSAGIDRATKLLAVSRVPLSSASSPEPQEPHDTAGELAAALAAMQPLTPQDLEDLQAAARPGSSYWHDEEGNIMPVDYAEFAPNPPPPTNARSAPSAPFVKFPEPVSGIWRNKDFDKPVMIVARMSEPGLPDHYLTEEGSGIPVSEVLFYN